MVMVCDQFPDAITVFELKNLLPERGAPLVAVVTVSKLPLDSVQPVLELSAPGFVIVSATGVTMDAMFGVRPAAIGPI